MTWTPVVGRLWRPLPDSAVVHGPGATFTPDADGGGTLAWGEHRVQHRRGFKPKRVAVTVRIAKACGAP